MHDVLACRHIDPAARPDVSGTEPDPTALGRTFTLIRDRDDHELATTASRQLRRSDQFLAAVHFMVGAGFHPKAGRTTLRLAEVFAARMKRSSAGHFPLRTKATATELGLKERAVLNHARYLRELGLLAYVEHGSKANALRTRLSTSWKPGDGYQPTATLFAAVAPPVWDEALGRRRTGHGYTARIIGVTPAGRRAAIEETRRKAKTKIPRQRTACTPSVVVPQDHRDVQVEGGKKNTPRQRAACPKTSPRTSTNGPRISPAECARAITIAQQLQREVWWLHRSCARRLAYALRPLITASWTTHGLAAELLTWGVPGFLRDPAAYVRHELARRQRQGDLEPNSNQHLIDDQVDDTGARHATMLREREERQTPIWQRYAQSLRPELRRRITDIRKARRKQRQQEQPRPDYRPQLREPEELHLRSLSVEAAWGEDFSPLEVYRAQARGFTPQPRRRSSPSAAEVGWLQHLREEHEAIEACAELRARLEEWEWETSTART
ncbi:hypothetical protein ACH4PU_30425 [Streptomyces sp. NPDC021100]|uniref:hypothetical protein n=1 Tax=Streptomyces sp. NPDC021100 TaxID=3365114 RepID=UPI0037B2E6B2